MKKLFTFLSLCLCCLGGYAQQEEDSIQTKELQEVMVKGYRQKLQNISQLPSVHQTYIMAGKKHEVISLQDLPGNIAEKTGRQIFAKIPGAFVYDMDGSGNQLNIATRGLDPHRSWEYNVRQNGVMTNSDIYGYPASHYSPPMEAVESIELVRGTASLQYGSQFGGMINYVLKKPDTTGAISFESLNSVGSYGLFSSYNAIGGKVGKWRYYTYYQKRVSDGYRRNASSDSDAQFINLTYQANKNLSIRAEVGRSTYLHRIAGALTDSMFYADPRQSTRSRNYFKPEIYVPSLSLNWHIKPATQLQWTTSAVLGTRSSVQYIGFATQPDIIDPVTNAYKNRQVDIDQFNSYTSELRISHQYRLGSLTNVLATGVRYINNHLHRQQVGKGTTGTDFDLSLVEAGFGRDLHFKTGNIALFAENLFFLTSKFTLSAGLRYEYGNSRMSGVIRYLTPDNIPNQIKHQFPLAGGSFGYQLSPAAKLYGGFSQAFRPVIFADIIPPTALDRIDPDLEDARGHNAEVGLQGNWAGKIQYDISLFQINYRNRIGTLIENDENGNLYVYKTNVGNTLTNGMEVFVQGNLYTTRTIQLALFTASSYFNAFYTQGNVVVNNENRSVKNNKLEGIPEWISRNGVQFAYKTLSASIQYSYVSKNYADALNIAAPNASGTVGLVPANGVWDVNVAYRFKGNYLLKAGMNNFTNKQYFTKRPSMYPGPGIWSSDGRSLVVTFGISI
ncbi:TonB-dependent receptor [Rhodocytophaga aerolata]|uniref:TonB-dependent receptor n=1 Tax=Rhodocytophaga aerolata TaxID=455078 RepID=A0ABT8R226_9BACT|nr:TonB-dependent receptor [Rhodocytophaga aerolata]MDO1445434.1 TonB-dependent receptor [Rhodocytophaga aerolata]